MKGKKYLVFLVAAIMAFCMMGLSACGGGGSSEPQLSDEELVKADVEEVVGTYVSKDTLAEQIRANEDIAKLVELGFDVDAYAENMANIMKAEVVDVKVDGDTAVATLELTLPDFGDKANELITTKALEMAADLETTSMTEDEQVAFAMEVMNAALSDPDFPRASSTLDIDYVKSGDTWQMKDKAAVEKQFEETANATSNLA